VCLVVLGGMGGLTGSPGFTAVSQVAVSAAADSVNHSIRTGMEQATF